MPGCGSEYSVRRRTVVPWPAAKNVFILDGIGSSSSGHSVTPRAFEASAGRTERLSASQPAVSQQVRALEEDLAIALFKRSGPRIDLTPAGTRLYQLASPLVEGLDRLPGTFEEQYHGVASGALGIAAGQTSASMWLPECLAEFKQRHPDIRVNIRVADGSERMRWLRTYEVDVVLTALDMAPR